MSPKERYQLRLKELQSSASSASGVAEAVTYVHDTLELAYVIAESVVGSSNADTALVLGTYDRLVDSQSKRKRSLLKDEAGDAA